MSGGLALVVVLAFVLLINNVPIWAALVFACIPYFIINDVPQKVVAFEHPFIREFFLGGRGQRAMALLTDPPTPT